MSSGCSTVKAGKDLKCVLVDARFSFPKNDANKRQILDFLIEIEDLVNNVKGKYSSNWEDVSDERKVTINLELPDREHVDEVCEYLNKINALLPDYHNSEGNNSTLDSSTDTPEQCTSSQLPQHRTMDSLKEPLQSKSSKNIQKQRAKHSCPFPSCKSKVIHLPRHMKQSHGWSPRKARSVLGSFGLRKEKDETTRKTKRSYARVTCPVQDCMSAVKRIQNHLTTVHKLKAGSKYYKKCLANAKRHEIEVIDTSESSESAETSDTSESSPKAYKPPPKKVKKIDLERPTNVYETIYGSSMDESEESSFSDSQLERNDDQLELSDEQCEEIGETEIEEDLNAVTAQVFDVKLQTIFDQFESWLKGPDGGSRGIRSATQCRRQVEIVVNYIDSSKPNLANILDKTKLRDEWLHNFQEEKQPGTTKSYLSSLNQFYIFLKCENIEVNCSTEQLTSLADQMKLWARSFRKKSQDRFWEKRMEDMASLRTPQQVKEFDTSDVARTAVSLIGGYEDKEEDSPAQSEYTSVRDYLLTILCINNGARSGTLSNMTLGEFYAATREDGCFVVRVKNHKTFAKHGPVDVVFTPSLHKYTEIFIKKFRNRLENASTDVHSTVFPTLKGKKMQSSQVGSQIGACWGKVFGKETSSGGATAFRKAAVSAVHECNEQMRGDLANLMVHKQSTADRYYLLKNKSKSAVKTSKELSKIMRSSGAVSTEENVAMSSKGHAPKNSPGPAGRHKWTSVQILEIKSAFARHINQKSITMEQVRRTVENTPILHGISQKKVLDKIRSYFGQDVLEGEELPPLPSETESLQDRLKRAGLEKPQLNDDVTAQDEMINQGKDADITSHDEIRSRGKDADITSQDEVISQGIDDTTNKNLDDSERDFIDKAGKLDDACSLYAPSTSGSKKTMQSLLTIEEEEIFSASFSKLAQSSKPINMDHVAKVIEKNSMLCSLRSRFTDRQLADRVRTMRKAFRRTEEKNNLKKVKRK